MSAGHVDVLAGRCSRDPSSSLDEPQRIAARAARPVNSAETLPLTLTCNAKHIMSFHTVHLVR
jgi:hypothetical protein